MGIAPNPQFPERSGNVYERKLGPNMPGGRGPLRFEEGVATDTDIPTGFERGLADGYVAAPGRPGHNAKVDTKYPQETMAERAHVGSAAWVEAPEFLGEFAHGSFADYDRVEFEQVDRSGARYQRMNPSQVWD